MKIGLLGVGRLGLCFALNLDRFGFSVVGYDKNKDYVKLLNSRQLESEEKHVTDLLQKCKIKFTDDINDTFDCELLFILVDTPSLENNAFDQSKIDEILSQIKSDVPIVISSTVMPGYCDSTNNPNVLYNPQFVAQGSIIENQINPDFVLIGSNNERHTETLKHVYNKMLYSSCRANFKVMDRLSAEITKLALNCYVTMKISFANMIGDISEICGADQAKILDALADDERIGGKCLKYGYGYGGPCFPRDNKAFSKFSNDIGFDAILNLATDETNRRHLLNQLDLIEKGVYPQNVEKTGDEFIIKGVTYKKDSDIIECSQQLQLAVELARDHIVTIVDKPSVVDKISKIYGNLFRYES